MRIERSDNSAVLVSGGAATMVVVMGIGRFAFTPILPLMQSATGMSHITAGWLASVNYMGYLVGALSVRVLTGSKRTHAVLIGSLALSVASTGAMGVTRSIPAWDALRFISGVASGLAFTIASGMVLDHLARHRSMRHYGWTHGGIGIGIALSGAAVPVFAAFHGWIGAWIGMGLVSFVLAAWATYAFAGAGSPNVAPAAPPRITRDAQRDLFWLTMAYGCAGFGYIVTATFLVVIARESTVLAGVAEWLWVMVGISAISASVLWLRVARRFGLLATLRAALLVQAVAVVLPAVTSNAVLVALSAILFGGTFTAIATLAFSAAREIAPGRSVRLVGGMTVLYGIGQIAGPVCAGYIAAYTGSFRLTLVLASIVLLAATALLRRIRRPPSASPGKPRPRPV